jgi:hypothetical protein
LFSRRQIDASLVGNFTEGTMSKRGKGERCAYCKRTLESVTASSRVAATRDHVVPKSRGAILGERTVWACRLCNMLKANMMPDEWAWFMHEFPFWWKIYGQNGDAKKEMMRYRRESLGQAPLTAGRGTTGQPPATDLVLGSQQSAGAACGQTRSASE